MALWVRAPTIPTHTGVSMKVYILLEHAHEEHTTRKQGEWPAGSIEKDARVHGVYTSQVGAVRAAWRMVEKNGGSSVGLGYLSVVTKTLKGKI